MSVNMDRKGTFRGQPVGYSLNEYQSGAIAINLQIQVEEAWEDETSTWVDWRAAGVVAEGKRFVVKKDGTLNEKEIETLVQHLDWDGNFTSVLSQTWNPTHCQFQTESNVYKDIETFQISWISGYDETPSGGQAAVGNERARVLQSLHGSKIRALTGNLKRNTPEPTPVPETFVPGPPPETTGGTVVTSKPPIDIDPDIPF